MTEPMTNDEARKRYESAIKGGAQWAIGMTAALLGCIFGYGIVAICALMLVLCLAVSFITYDKAH